jgi:hypothetical protein
MASKLDHPTVRDSGGRACSLELAKVYALAAKAKGLTLRQFGELLGLGQGGNGRRAAERLRMGSRLSWETYLDIARMAAIPDPHAAVIYARSFIPESHAHLRTSIGCATKVRGSRHNREAREVMAQIAPAADVVLPVR